VSCVFGGLSCLCRAFLLILQTHRKTPLPLSTLLLRVKEVLHAHSDLAGDFEAFLPEMRG
jgi:histone deacetylase complex regulatory component SIN3